LSFETKQQGRSEEEEEEEAELEEGIAGHLFLCDKNIFYLLGFLLDLQLIEPVGL
jgi:hypothetical protein